MTILFFSTKEFEKPYLTAANSKGFTIKMISEALNEQSASLADGYDAISIFSGDDASAPVLEKLHQMGVKHITIRAAGYDNTDIQKATALRMDVANVPDYSPHAIAEHTIAMMLALDRKLILADKRVKQYDFRVDDLAGFNLHKKTVGIIGMGKIGGVVAKILHGFGCHILAYDLVHNEELAKKYDINYCSIDTLCENASIITLHTPLNENTKHLMNDSLIKKMKKGVMLINTARGAVVDTVAIIHHLQNGHIGFYGMDVYDKEKGLFFYDHSHAPVKDEQLQVLMSMPNVLITPHQAFATKEAFTNIATATFYNLQQWEMNENSSNELTEKHTLKIETTPI